MVIFTIGYEGRDFEEYAAVVVAHDVRMVIDVRKNPISRKFGFSKNRMRGLLRSEGIEYLHIPRLGIESARRKGLKNRSDYEELLDWYGQEVLPLELESLQVIADSARTYERVALTCFEADPKMCHRLLVSESVSELLAIGKSPVHL